MLTKSSLKRLVVTILSASLLVSASTAMPSQAAVPKLDTIRVALFMSLPGKYDSTTAAATFSSSGGLKVGAREPSGVKHWFDIPAGEQSRFALDDYKAKLFESANFAQTLEVYRHVKASGGTAFLTSVAKKGSIVYEVAEGAYATAAEATAAVSRWTADAKLAGLVGGFKAKPQGPFHLETAPLANQAAAAAAAAAFGAADLDAFIAARQGANGDIQYSVMVGAATAAGELAALRTAAAKVSGGAGLKEADVKAPYMMLRDDYSISGTAGSGAMLYSIGGTNAKIWISPAAQEPIQLTERSNRTYRGDFELSALNGKLAVINELPFEEYLYSVVAVEMYPAWPIEALKAQAVAARSYALNKGLGFQIAHVVDTTLSQAYYGTNVESPNSTAAVEATKGEVALYNGQVIEALFSSSAGGMSANSEEIWNNSVPYLKAVESPDDASEANLLSWYRVALTDGRIGYIREDLLKDSGQKTAAGSVIMEVTADAVNVRRHPIVQEAVPAIAQVDKGARVIALEKAIESNPMNWVRGPFTGEELLTAINARVNPKLKGPITEMEASKRGASGRITELLVNGEKLAVSSPDSLRSILGVQGSLPSTLFSIEETGKLVIEGAGGAKRTKSAASQTIYVIGADGKPSAASQDYLFVMDSENQIRAATKDPGFRFIGTGNGHGAGLSQYGALSLAQQGYDYQYILKYYYKDVTIAKE